MASTTLPSSETKTIFLAADNNFSVAYGIALQSLLQSADSSTIYDIHVLDDHIDQEVKHQVDSLRNRYNFKLTYHDVSKVVAGVAEKKFFPRVAFARFIIPDLLPDLKEGKVFYTDVDILVKEDLSPLFATDMKGSPLGAVQALNLTARDNNSYLTMLKEKYGIDFLQKDAPYYQSGALLYDVAAWRQGNFTEKILDMSRQDLPAEVSMPDQDIMNIVCHKHIIPIPVKYCIIPNFAHRYTGDYNATYAGLSIYTERELKDAYEKPSIIHYAADKPLVYGDVIQPLEKEFLNFWKHSLWSNRIPYFSKRFLWMSALPERKAILERARDADYSRTITVAIYTSNLLKCCSASALVDTVNSVHQQTWPYIEILVLDNYSDDGTTDLLKKFSEQKILRYIPCNKNLHDLRNTAYAEGLGNYVYFLQLGETLPKDYIEKLFLALERESTAPLASFIDEGLEAFGKNGNKLLLLSTMPERQILKKQSQRPGDWLDNGISTMPHSREFMMLAYLLDNQIQKHSERMSDSLVKYTKQLNASLEERTEQQKKQIMLVVQYPRLNFRYRVYHILSAITFGRIRKRFVAQKRKYKQLVKEAQLIMKDCNNWMLS